MILSCIQICELKMQEATLSQCYCQYCFIHILARWWHICCQHRTDLMLFSPNQQHQSTPGHHLFLHPSLLTHLIHHAAYP